MMATESLPRRWTHAVFTPQGIAIHCGRCGGLAPPAPDFHQAWANWRPEHDTLEHRGLRVVEKVVEVVREVQVPVPGPERVVERVVYLCHQCDQTFNEQGFRAHREQCAAQMRQRTVAMLEEQIRALGLQDRLRVRH
jgi:hypothetical protein